MWRKMLWSMFLSCFLPPCFFPLHDQLLWGNPRDPLALCWTQCLFLRQELGWQMGPDVVWLLVVPFAAPSAAGQDSLNTAGKKPVLKMDWGLQAISVTLTCVQANCVYNSASSVVLTKLLASELSVCLEMALWSLNICTKIIFIPEKITNHSAMEFIL